MTGASSSRNADDLFQIGEVADRVGLSIRTIRYYEEIGLVVPSGRTEGGFRLYRDEDVRRLELIKALKPTGVGLEQLVELVTLASSSRRSESQSKRLAEMIEESRVRVNRLVERLGVAAAKLDDLDRDVNAPADR